jgi:multimeric flavodoxin WrbA
MKKLLGIVASYRKVGNCEIVVKAVAERLGDGWECTLVRLPKLSIKPCKGCYACMLPGMKCNISDDMEWLFDRVREADAIVVAAPNYILGPVGMVKMVTDRTLQGAKDFELFQGKKTAVALTLGKEEYRGYADTALVSQVAGLGLDVASLELFYGTHPGEIALEKNFEEKIQRLADSLVSEEPATEALPNRCPVCRSDLFRLRPEGFECALCKSMAKLEDDRLKFFYFHPAFTKEGQMEHLEWILGKKEEYPRLKDRLKEIQDRYRGGQWVHPAG